MAHGYPQTAASFLQAGPVDLKLVGAGLAIVGAAMWQALTSVLAVALAVLFLVDLVLGLLVALGRGGLGAFCWEKFWKAFVKMGAAVAGIALFAVGDVMLHEAGVPPGWQPLTTAWLWAACWGFFWSGLQNLSFFFPGSAQVVERALHVAQKAKPE